LYIFAIFLINAHRKLVATGLQDSLQADKGQNS